MKQNIYLYLLFIGFSISASCLFAQKNQNQEFDAILKKAFTIEGPGATAIVAKDGKILYEGTIGHANVELEVPMSIDNIFRIGSITKQFTTVGIMMLVEEGKIGLQDEITKYIPDYPTQGKTITIEHLLTHTSGIKSMTNMPTFMSKARVDMTPDEVVDFFKNEEMEFDPGTAYNYNNSGFFLLGVIIEKLSGKSYAEFIEERIFDKVGMESSYYDSFSKIIKKRAGGYQMGAAGLKNADYLSETLPYAAGSLLSTVGDLYKWNQALLQNKLISEESREKAWTSYVLADGKSTGYGYGWSVGDINGKRSISHGGGIFGFLSMGILLPEENLYVAVFSNCNCQDPSMVAVDLAKAALKASKK